MGTGGRVHQSGMQEDTRDSKPPGVTGLGAVVHCGGLAGGEDGLRMKTAFSEHLCHSRAFAEGFTCLVLSKRYLPEPVR